MDQKSDEFKKMLNDSLSEVHNPKIGNKITGKIIDFTQENIIISLDWKQDAVATKSEYEKELKTLKIGDEINGYILKRTDTEITVGKALSKAHSNQMAIEDSYKNNIPISAKVIKKIKGGFLVDFEGSKLFCPFSHIDIKRVEEPDEYIDKSFDFNIITYDKKNTVVSRKKILEKKQKQRKREALEKLKVGMVVRGKVEKFVNSGAFINLGNISAYLRVSDIDWSRVSTAKEILKIDQETDVKIVDIKGDRIRVSLKDLVENPMIKAVETHKKGDIVKCRVISLQSFGVFVEITKGVEGLIPISQMSWGKSKKSVNEIVEVDQVLEAQILKVNKKDLKISLSLLALLPNPWDNFSDYIKEGELVKGTIEQISKIGLFLKVVDGLTGLFPYSKMKSSKLFYDTNDVGKEITLRVISINKQKHQFSLDSPKGSVSKTNKRNDFLDKTYSSKETNWKKYAKDTHKKKRIKSPFDIL